MSDEVIGIGSALPAAAVYHILSGLPIYTTMDLLKRLRESSKKTTDRGNMPLPKPPDDEPRRGSAGDPRYHDSPRLAPRESRSASLPGQSGSKAATSPPMTAIPESNLPQRGGSRPMPALPSSPSSRSSGRSPSHHDDPPRLPPKPATSNESMSPDGKSPPPRPERNDRQVLTRSTRERKPQSVSKPLPAPPSSRSSKNSGKTPTGHYEPPRRLTPKSTSSDASISPHGRSSPSQQEGEDPHRRTRNIIRESQWRVPRDAFERYVVSIQQSPSRFNEQFTVPAVPAREFPIEKGALMLLPAIRTGLEGGPAQGQELADVGTSQSTNAGREGGNTSRNLFRNVVPFDDSRVKLTEGEASDYINASYVDGCMSSWGYIACQLPPSNCVADWWRMVWEKNIIRVVLMESPARRARRHNLWPEEILDICDYGSFKVHWVEETVCDYCISRKMFIQQERFRRPVMLYELTTPAFDRSEATVSSLANFRQLIHREMKKDTTKLLVCCRLGAGRTGTFICVDRVAKQLAHGGLVEIYHTLHSMRQQRMLLVKNVEEYELVHLCVLHLIKNKMVPGPDDAFSAELSGTT